MGCIDNGRIYRTEKEIADARLRGEKLVELDHAVAEQWEQQRNQTARKELAAQVNRHERRMQAAMARKAATKALHEQNMRKQ